MTAFRATLGGTNIQGGFTGQAYNQLALGSEDYDAGNRYASGIWTPIQAGDSKLVVFSGQVWESYDGGGAQSYDGSHNTVVRIVKNGNPGTGVTIGTAIGTKGPFANDWVCAISMQDLAQPGDYYGLYLYVYNGSAWVDGHPLHTFWAGGVVG